MLQQLSLRVLVHGAKHVPPGDKFQKSGDPLVTLVETSFHKVSYCQIASKWSIFDSDQHILWRRFQLCPPEVPIPSAHVVPSAYVWQHLEILENSDFVQSRFMKSRGVKHRPLWFLMPQVFLHVLVIFENIDFWWYLVGLWCSHGRIVLRTPLLCKRSAPSSNRVHLRFWVRALKTLPRDDFVRILFFF